MENFLISKKPSNEFWNFDVEICSSRREEKVKISNFIGLFCVKDKLVGQKTDTASLLCWHWRAMKSFSKIWIVLSNSAYPKMVKFLQAGKKMEIWSFIGLFCLKNPNFWGAELEIRGQILLKLSFTVRTGNCYVSFLVKQFIF